MDGTDVFMGAGALLVGAVVVTMGVMIASDSEPDGLAVCTDPNTWTRVDDSMCGDFDDDGSTTYAGGFHYMIFDSRTYRGDIPAVGKPMPAKTTTGFVRTYSPGLKIGKGVEAKGTDIKAAVKSTIQRGGFGVKGASSGSSGS